MALLDEELVQEWLNVQGYFTIRGVKRGKLEMDILALKVDSDGARCRHIEVQVSHSPLSYITPLSKAAQKRAGTSARSAKKRSTKDLREAVKRWCALKFDDPDKRKLKKDLCDAEWTREMVVHRRAFEREIDMIRDRGVKVIEYGDILRELQKRSAHEFQAAGRDLVQFLRFKPTKRG